MGSTVKFSQLNAKLEPMRTINQILAENKRKIHRCSACKLALQRNYSIARYILRYIYIYIYIYIIVETIGPYLYTSMSIYTLCGSSGYQVPIKDSCTCST